MLAPRRHVGRIARCLQRAAQCVLRLVENPRDELAWFDLDRLPSNVIPYIRRALENMRRGRWFDSFGWRDA